MHRTPPLRRWIWCMALCMLWIVGCAQPTSKTVAEEDMWSGRLALQIEGQASQSFSAMFELHGNAQNGVLVLLSPLGNRLAQLNWKDGHAQLQSGQETRTSESLDALLQDVTGTRIPIAALFSWLHGTQTTATGWQADLSGIAEGRLVARRDDPAPQATLRIALTR
ncbi:outer membrane lipoprotein LolB [Acidovorax sp. 69]|nr:outer membrane lipoprotein LolB [Acidovorax sp. 69]